MDLTKIVEGIIQSGPLAAVLFFMWWTERKDKIAGNKKADAISIKHETYLRENADRLLAFSEEQRKALAEHDKRIDSLVHDLPCVVEQRERRRR